MQQKMGAIGDKLAGMTLNGTLDDPPLDRFLSKQPAVKLPVLLDDLEAEPGQPSIYQLVKGLVGKDLTQPMPMPVELCEPSSDMMKRIEDIEYTELLDQAAELPKASLQRLIRVAAFSMSSYSACHMDRIGKPLFVIPGETVEAVFPKKGVRYIGEAVQDHGWAVVAHAEGRKWGVSTDDQLKLKIGMNSLEFVPRWSVEVRFKDGDVYTFKKLSTSANQTVTQPIFVSHLGTVTVNQVASGRQAVIAFSPIPRMAMTTRSRRAACRSVGGHILEGERIIDGVKFEGYWDSHLDMISDKGACQRLWTRTPLPDGANRFKIPAFTVGNIKLTPALKKALPPTDSRLRKDVYLIEAGKWKEAAIEKARLEAIGHGLAAEARKNGDMLQPRWFVADPKRKDLAPGEGIRWRYNNKYWAAKENGFADVDLPSLFA